MMRPLSVCFVLVVVAGFGILTRPRPSAAEAPAKAWSAEDLATARAVCDQAAKKLSATDQAECLHGMLYDFPIPPDARTAQKPELLKTAASLASTRCMSEMQLERVTPICKRSLILVRALQETGTVSNIMSKMAYNYIQLNQNAEAERIFNEMLEMSKTPEGKQWGLATTAYGGFLNLQVAVGNWEQVIYMRTNFNSILRADAPVTDNDRRLDATVLAGYYRLLGKFEQAEKLLEKAISLTKLGEPGMLVSLLRLKVQLAECLQSQGKYDQARSILTSTLAMVAKQQDKETLKSLLELDLSQAYYRLEDYNNVETHIKRLFATSQSEKNAVNDGLMQGGLLLLTRSRAFSGNQNAAEKASIQLMELTRKMFKETEQNFIIALAQNAWLQGQFHRVPEAIKTWHQIIRTEETWLRQESAEGALTALLEKLRFNEDGVYWLAHAHPKSEPARRLAMGVALLRKGRVVEEGARLSQALRTAVAKGEMGERYQRWQQARAEREQLLLRGLGEGGAQQYLSKLQSLKLQADQLEHELTTAARAQLNQRFAAPELDDVVARVAQRLPPGSALLEIVTVTRPPDITRGAAHELERERHYLAFLLFPDQSIEVLHLGTATEVEKQVSGLLQKLRKPNQDPIPEAQALFRTLFGSQRLPASRLYISPDGALNVLPFAALHDGKGYLVERLPMHYLTSGRDLLRDATPASKHPPLLLADPAFDAAPANTKEAAGKRFVDVQTRGLYDALPSLGRLPGTRQEAATVKKFVGGQLLLERKATEQALRKTAAPRLLHLATHGFFFSEKVTDADDSAAAPASGRWVGLGLREALSLSVILLTGASQAATATESEQDGILTADEVRSLDLKGTQLVVLSACDTGRGVIRWGQGVAGLRRAFLVAGAETLVVSLWSVADVQTGELIERYYHNLVKEGKSRVTALQDAMLELKQRHPHPYYWAPFIALGRDGPLTVGSIPKNKK